MDEEKYLNLIAQFLSGELSEDLKHELFSWRDANEDNKSLFNEITEIWELTKEEEVVFNPEVDKAWEKIESNFDIEKTEHQATITQINATRKNLKTIRQLLRIAAVLIVALGVAFWLYISNSSIEDVFVEVKTNTEKEMVKLPDGSTIWLNHNTIISYAKDFDPRVINLEGEAFFDVEKLNGKPFKIISGDTKTVVLGTSFNVRAYPKEEFVEVTVETGKVAFSPKEEKTTPVFITANHSAVFDNEKKEATIIEKKIINANAWQTHQLVFKEDLMKDVIPMLERYFEKDFKVSNDAILNCPFNGSFKKEEKNASLADLLKILTISIQVEITEIGDKIILTGEGCN